MGHVPLTNITIPVFNRYEETLTTIDALRKTAAKGFVLTVVDNGSDAPLGGELLRLYREGVIDHLFVLDANYGVSCACNVGWNCVEAPFFLKLDNDIKVFSASWLEDLYALWGRRRYDTVLGPVWNCAEERGRTAAASGTLWDMPVSFSGAAFFVSAKVRGRIGCFSEDYGLYGEEDADYCMRCHHAGIRKYTFEASGVLEHMGNDDAVYAAHNVRKRALHDANVGSGERAGLFALNLFLYRTGLRGLRVPLKYRVKSRRGCFTELEENSGYQACLDRLKYCLDIFNQAGGEPSREDMVRMRVVLQPCGKA